MYGTHRKAPSADVPNERRAMQLIAGLVALALSLGVAGCARPDPARVRLGETAVPALAAHPSGRIVPNRIVWSKRLSGRFNQAATRWSAGRWVVITQTETTRSGRPLVIVQAVAARSGRLTPPRAFAGTTQAPFVFTNAGRPLVLLTSGRAKQARLRAIDAATGRQRWAVAADLGFRATQPLWFKAAGASGDLLVGSLAGSQSGPNPCALCALDSRTGRVRWSLRGVAGSDANLVGSINIGRRSVAAFLGEGAGKYVVVDRATGKVLASAPWTRRLDTDPTSFLTLRTGFLAMAAPDEQGYVRVRALDEHGRICWGESVRPSGVAAATPSSVALPTRDGGLEARDLLTGRRRWVIAAADVAASELALTINAGTRVTGAVSTLSITLDGQTGEPLWAGPYTAITPEAWNGHTYFGWARDGRLTAYEGNGLPPVGADISLGDVPIFVG